MKRIALSIFVASAVISCKESSSEALFVEKETTPQTETVQTQATATQESASENQAIEIKTEPAATTPAQIQKFNVEQPQKPAQQTGVTAAGFEGKPNPAHGQPGHRCDVKVGEPLPFNNAAPKTVTKTPTPITPTVNQPAVNVTPSAVQQPQQTATTGVTAPGFSGKPNPAHGQPGHRCDIKVGEILP
ncbi:MAG: hypothetical protein WCY89_11625 [Flavobacteriaceae bacterium]